MDQNRKHPSKTPLLLMELIMCIMFFALTGTVCIALFVKAHNMAEASVALTNSTMITQNAAEIFQAKEGNIDAILEVYSGSARQVSGSGAGNTLVILYDKNWNEIPHSVIQNQENVASYEMLMSISESNPISAVISVIRLSGSADTIDSADAIDSAESIDSADTIDSTESIDSTDVIDSEGGIDSTDAIDSEGGIEFKNSADNEIVTSPSAIDKDKLIYSLETKCYIPKNETAQ